MIDQAKAGLTGHHTITNYAPLTRQDQILLNEFEKWMNDGRGGLFEHRVVHLITEQDTYKNITTTVGRNFLAQVLCNTFTGTNAYVTHLGIGTSNTAAAIGDTALGTETFRKAVSSGLDSTNVANISTFLGASEANFTWEEWGHFIDGTITTDSGTMLSHHIQSVTKASPDTKTIDSTYTLTDA